MIHLTSQNFSPKEIIQNVFSPLVGVCASLSAEEICQKNNLSFVELLQPFTKLSSDAHFRDVSGTSVSVKGLRLNVCDVSWRPPQPNLARKLLNESVTSAQCEGTTMLYLDGGNLPIEKPVSEMWFEQWRETFFTVQFPADHEFTRHFLCCQVVVSSAEPNALDTANQLTKKVQMMQNVTPPKLPKWFSNDVLICYVMIHDAATGDITRAQAGFESLKMTFGENRCFLLQINSSPEVVVPENVDVWIRYLKRHQKHETSSGGGSEQDSAPKTPQDITGVTAMPTSVHMSSLETPPSEMVTTVVTTTGGEGMLHPLSPVQDTNPTDAMSSAMSTSSDSLTTQPMNPNVWSSEVGYLEVPHGMWLTGNDIENIKHFVQDFTIRALIPYIEKQVGLLNDSITNKKGVSRSLLSATKRWFVTNKPGVNTAQNAVVYTNESTELQIRKLGDLYFMFGNYNLAFQSYHQAKRDFNADSAWQYYAGALEMAALAAFMQGQSSKKTYDYMEESIVTYLNSCKMPQFATRATLLSVECLKAARLFGEAAKQLIRMTSEDSDLRSALLLEQAAYCFLYSEPALYRKYAFHSVLAGHRFSKSGQRKHAFRCYKQAYRIFERRGWSLAEDHIQYTIGKQAVTLKKLDEASRALAHLLRPSSMQDAQQQYAFLREYIATQKAIHQNDSSDILDIALPNVVEKMTRVLVTSPQLPVTDLNVIAATNLSVNSSLDDKSIWDKLEDMVVNVASKKPVMVFKPSHSLFTSEISCTENPLAIIGEPIEISLTIENTIKPQISFEDIHLLWTFTREEDGAVVNNRDQFRYEHQSPAIDNMVASTSISAVQINGQEKLNIAFVLVPKAMGMIEVIGLIGKISAMNDTISLLGQIMFEKIPIKVKETGGYTSAASIISANVDPFDKRLQIKILPPAPTLQVNFSAIPVDVLAGEVIPVQIFLSNFGADALSDIYVATDDPRSVLINAEQNELPLSILKDFRDLSNETFSKDKEARRQHVFKLFSGDDRLVPGDNKTTTIWLQAPYKKGAATIRILIYYGMPAGYPRISYRLIRHEWSFQVNESICLEANCNISNVKTNEVGIDLNVKNLNQVHHALTTEILLSDINLYCSNFKINQDKKIVYLNSPGYYRIFTENSGLKSTESLHMRIPLNDDPAVTTNDPLTFIRSRLSGFKIQTIDGQDKFLPQFLAIGNFLTKFETKFVQVFGQIGNSEEFNNIITNIDRHMTICVTWKGHIYENSSFQRSAFGQHFVQLRNLYETVYSMAHDHRSKQITSFASHEDLFSIYDFKEIGSVVDDDDGDWAVNNVSVSRRCFLEDDSFGGEFQEIALKA